MLPDFRFVFGALTIIAVTGMIGVGLFVSARLFHQAKMGPLESGRNLAFADSAEWNQFYEPGGVRRFVGLAPQGEAREIGDLPPVHRPQVAAPAALTLDLAPVEVAEQDDGVETAPLSVRPSMVADPAATDVAPPGQRASTVAAPSMLNQADEAVVTERTPVVNADTVVDIKPGPAETVAVHAAPMPVRSDPASVTGRVATAPADSETALPERRKVPPSVAPHPPAALAKAVVPAPAARAPVKRALRADDDEDERPRAASPARSRKLASHPRAAPQAHAPQRNGTQRVDPRQSQPGQPVFGPHFPYATPQSGQPVFGPHFPYATPQARRPRQPSYGPAYGRR